MMSYLILYIAPFLNPMKSTCMVPTDRWAEWQAICNYICNAHWLILALINLTLPCKVPEFSPPTRQIPRQTIHFELVIKVVVVGMRLVLQHQMYCGPMTFFLQPCFNNMA
jgi:hypothetical protein